ncbi:hypothetical protein JCM11641_007194 [Rhodosporidiobolus odoratus]
MSTTSAKPTSVPLPPSNPSSGSLSPHAPKSTSTAPPTSTRASKAPRRRKPLKRRGARPDSDESETEQPARTADSSDTDDSDFAPSLHASEDEDDEDDDASSGSDEGGAAPEPQTPATASIDQLDTTAGTGSAKALLAGQELHPSWSDMPAAGEAGASQLPTLDFANLSLDAVAAVPAASAPREGGKKANQPPTPKQPRQQQLGADGKPLLSKKQLALQRKEQKSAELKAKDPVAWEAREKEMQEKEEQKKLAKKERLKEKRKEKKAAEKAAKESAAPSSPSAPTAPLPSSSTSKPAAAGKPSGPVVPSRPSRTALAHGLVAPTDNDPSSSTPAPPSTSTSASHPSSRPIVPAFQRTPSFVSKQPQRGPPPATTDAFPSNPKGRFWGHDERLNPARSAQQHPQSFRGGARGGGNAMRGFGAARGRGGRGGAAAAGMGRGPYGPDRWTAEGNVVAEPPLSPKRAKKGEKKEEEEKDGDSDDNWGRGEAKRAPRPSAVLGLPDWSHAGFEELEAEEKARDTAPVPSGPAAMRGRGRGRGGFATPGGVGRGGFAGRGTLNGPPGAINPRYAHLPFHPLHRFPAALSAQQPSTATAHSADKLLATLPAAPAPTSQFPAVVPQQPQPELATTSSEQELFGEDTAALDAKKPTGVVRLPSAGASQFQLAVKGAAAARAKEEADKPTTAPVVEAEKENEPVRSPQPAAAAADLELRKQQGASILYAADPSRFANPPAEVEDVSAPAASFPSYEQRAPHDVAGSSLPPHLSGLMNQVPPHLQSPPTIPSPYAIPRHDSPVYFPPPHAYYSPDAFSVIPSPGLTPPPLAFPTHPAHAPPSSAYFLPPSRSKRVEIKAPSRDGQSPIPVKTTISTGPPSFGGLVAPGMQTTASSSGATGGSASPTSVRAMLPSMSPPPSHVYSQHPHQEPQQPQQYNPYAAPPPQSAYYPSAASSAPLYPSMTTAYGAPSPGHLPPGSFEAQQQQAYGNYYVQAQQQQQQQQQQHYNPYAAQQTDGQAMYGAHEQAMHQGYYGGAPQGVEQLVYGMY